MTRYTIQLFLALTLLFTFQSLKAQDSTFRKDNRDVFNLAPTMFCDNGQLGSLSYGINNTTFSPSYIAQAWTIPNYRLNILSNEIKYCITLNRFTLSVRNTNMHGLSYNYEPNGTNVNFNFPKTTYELDIKVIKSKRKFAPDFGLGFLAQGYYPFYLCLGNTKNKLKYYGTIECKLDYALYPAKYSYGLSYNLLKNLDLTLEYCHESNNFNQALFMINSSPSKFISLQGGVYYYKYVFEDYIPETHVFQGGQEVILDVNPKASYFLISGKIIIHLSPFKKFKNYW